MKNKLGILAISLIILASACKEKCANNECVEPADEPTKDTTLTTTMKFNAVFNDTALNWSKYYTTSIGDKVRFEKLKFIFSHVKFTKTDNSVFEPSNFYGYLNLKDGINTVQFKNIPKGSYKSISIMVGLDSAINHGDPIQWSGNHPLNPAYTDLHWAWSGGYIFNLLEGLYKNGNSDEAFSFHVATLKYARTHVINGNFTISKNGTIEMNIDMDKYFSSTINYSLTADGSFSHSAINDPAMDKFIQNAATVISYKKYTE